MKRKIGGDRLGSGNKMNVDLKTYNRTTVNMSKVWRSTMASGTLVPFLNELALPGDTFDIDLEAEILTHPTIGPLFGSYKVQLDIFQCPIRLYQGLLHNNKLGIGNQMEKVKIPQIKLKAKTPDKTKLDIDNEQINSSCLLSYLDIRGVGMGDETGDEVEREFSALGVIGYWDIYKNYYANKSEEIGAVIHGAVEEGVQYEIADATYYDPHLDPENPIIIGIEQTPGTPANITPHTTSWIYVQVSGEEDTLEKRDWVMENMMLIDNTNTRRKVSEYYEGIDDAGTSPGHRIYKIELLIAGMAVHTIENWDYAQAGDIPTTEPLVRTFPLENLDTMRENILKEMGLNDTFVIDETTLEPYGWLCGKGGEDTYFKTLTQEGLGLKTYQSDLFNNWIQDEWINGSNGINAVTSVDTSSGSFEINQLILARKVYNMLNRIAVSGGTYEDYIDTVYTAGGKWRTETPIYMGGLSKELVFQEVIANSQSEDQPLGTLAGRGKLAGKHKGGKVVVRVDEPSIIMGIISLTPRIDYSQGNKWSNNIKNMRELHAPELDEIGFQDLITDQMAWWDTKIDGNGNPVFKSAGKQPAWINYTTNINETRGNFANENNQMWMTLNRRYEWDGEEGIKDLTTYIDPMKFNNIFAETSRDAQNFWAQIGVEMKTRRMMSAKLMPNL